MGAVPPLVFTQSDPNLISCGEIPLPVDLYCLSGCLPQFPVPVSCVFPPSLTFLFSPQFVVGEFPCHQRPVLFPFIPFPGGSFFHSIELHPVSLFSLLFMFKKGYVAPFSAPSTVRCPPPFEVEL